MQEIQIDIQIDRKWVRVRKTSVLYIVLRGKTCSFLFIQYHVAVFVFPFDWLGKVLQKYSEYWFLLDNRQYNNQLENCINIARQIVSVRMVTTYHQHIYASSVWNHPWHHRRKGVSYTKRLEQLVLLTFKNIPWTNQNDMSKTLLTKAFDLDLNSNLNSSD